MNSGFSSHRFWQLGAILISRLCNVTTILLYWNCYGNSLIDADTNVPISIKIETIFISKPKFELH